MQLFVNQTPGGNGVPETSRKAAASPGLMTRLPEYSAEVATPDRKSLEEAARLLPKDARVYVASLPRDAPERQVEVCTKISKLGLIPVPHIAARNIPDRDALNDLLRRLSGEAGVDRALVIGGDRDLPAGEFDNSLQLIESGLLQEYGIDKIAIAVYPEGHPRIPDDVLDRARTDKIAAARAGGLELILISQVCFESAPIIEFLRRIRAEGVTERVRVGVSGPAKYTSLIKYAMICGVGPSLRALKERQSLAKNILAGETPEKLILELEEAVAAEPSLNIWGIHFFTFASLKSTIEWVERYRGNVVPGC
jgi:methylenetetrahydrofolate reductase (NADPH)